MSLRAPDATGDGHFSPDRPGPVVALAFTEDFATAQGWFATFGNASFDQSATADVVGPTPGSTAVPFSGTPSPSCMAQKAEPTIEITDSDAVPVDLRVESPAGGHEFTKIPAGQTVQHTLPAKVAELAAGEAKLTAYKNVDGKGIQTVKTTAYPATTC